MMQVLILNKIIGRKRFFLFHFSFLLFLSTASAQNDSILLDQVVVTGTRTPKTLLNVPIQTRVITAQDIAKTDATDIEDLLRQELPGVEFSYAMNQMKHMNFSGFGGQNVLFLVDGERLAGETMDDVDFSRINMANVERIEIIKGAASALYGSNANGGVINVITKTPTEKWRANINGRHGRHNDTKYGATLDLNGKHISNTLAFQGTNLDTYYLENGPDPESSNIAYRIMGSQSYNVNDKLTWRPTQNLRLIGNLGYYFKADENKMDTNVPWHFRDLKAGLKSLWDINPNSILEVAYNFDQYDKAKHYRLSDRCYREYSNVQNSVRALYNYMLRQQTTDNGQKISDVLSIGADYMRDYLLSSNLTENTTLKDAKKGEERSYVQHNIDAFVQYDWNINDRWELVTALRWDHFSDGDLDRVTPRLNARYRPNRNLTFRAGYGMGFRAPALKEKYYKFNMASGIWDIVGSNIVGYDLKPELSHNFNVSAEYTKGAYNITLSGFYNHIRDRITTSAPRLASELPAGVTIENTKWVTYINVATYNTVGIDLTASARWHNGWCARLGYAYIYEPNTTDAAGNIINNQYTKARPHSINARVEWDHRFFKWYRLNAILSGRFLSGVENIEFVDYITRDDDGNLLRRTIDHPAYTIFKLSTIHHLSKAFHLTLAIDNLLNYKPEYHYFNAPLTDGASFIVGLSIDLEKL